jgi:hypothetical protein
LIDRGWHPEVFFRLWPRAEIEAAFDRWQRETHGAQLVEAPGAVHFGYFEAVTDLPQAYRSGVSRMDYYTARNLSDLFVWMSSDQLQAGLADGETWMRNLNEVDGAAFSANVYNVTSVIGADPGEEMPVLAERYEVPPALDERFDEWFEQKHAPAVAAEPGVVRVRTFRAVREGVPIADYRSPGNRMLRADLEPQRLRTALLSTAMMEALVDSMRWERDLEYVTRDVFRPLFSYTASSARSPEAGAET